MATPKIEVKFNVMCDRATLAHVEAAIAEYTSQHTVSPPVAATEVRFLHDWLRDMLHINPA